MNHDDLDDAARRWLAADPDPDTRAELAQLLEDEDTTALADRFDGRLQFGTAGIRAEMGAGPTRMNRLVVRQVTAGLAARLAQDLRVTDSSDGPVGEAARVVVLGHDARHKSALFAQDAAAVLGQAGFDVRMFSEPVPTPLVAFATRRLSAAAGVQITASHNPPRDNGYKVYWRGGAQIVAPLDAQISRAIETASGVEDLEGAPTPSPVPEEVVDAYRREALALVKGGGIRDVSIVYTPLHGVAGDIVTELLSAAGFTNVHAVPEQFTPDGDFPTVEFPNPEMSGTLDIAEALARDVGADLVLANDPDGDRIAVAVPDAGGITILTGDEVGCLLADALLREGLGDDGGASSGEMSSGEVSPGSPSSPARMVGTTVVSSQLLARIADDHNAEFVETLTGFKWLAKAVDDAVRRGVRPILCYEQALGVMLGDVVRDKDGITAALVVADLAARLAADNRTLRDVLDDLARRHGLHVTTGRSLVLTDSDVGRAGAIVEGLRRDPPTQVLGVEVVRVDDYVALQRRHADGSSEPIDLPSYPLVSLLLADGSRLQARPSGTEPLLKFYIEIVEPVAAGDIHALRRAAQVRLEAMADAFVATVT